jgi:hypothetical protein
MGRSLATQHWRNASGTSGTPQSATSATPPLVSTRRTWTALGATGVPPVPDGSKIIHSCSCSKANEHHCHANRPSNRKDIHERTRSRLPSRYQLRFRRP